MATKKQAATAQPQSGVLSAEQLLRGAAPRVATIPMREWGGPIRLREMTRAERKGLGGERAVLAQVLSLALVEPQLLDEEIDGLVAGLTQKGWEELDDQVARLNRLGKYSDLAPEEIQEIAFREPAGSGPQS